MKHTTIAVLAVVGLLLLGGCLEMTFTTEVTADGMIESQSVEMVMDERVATQLEERATEEDRTLEEHLAENAFGDIDEDAYDSVSTSMEELDDGDRRFTKTIYGLDPTAVEGLDVTVDGDTVRYEHGDPETDDPTHDGDDDDDGLLAELLERQFSIEYVVHMPGVVVDTNAHEIDDDGSTVTWDLMEHGDDRLYVESSTAEDANPAAVSERLPGLGLTAGIVAFSIVLFALSHSTRRL